MQLLECGSNLLPTVGSFRITTKLIKGVCRATEYMYIYVSVVIVCSVHAVRHKKVYFCHSVYGRNCWRKLMNRDPCHKMFLRVMISPVTDHKRQLRRCVWGNRT